MPADKPKGSFLQDCRWFLLLCHTFRIFYNTPHPLREPGYHGWYVDWLRAGRSGVRIPTDFFSSPKTVQSAYGYTQRGYFMKLTSHPHTVPRLRMGEYASTPSVCLYDMEWGSFTFQIIPSPRKLNAHVLTQNDNANRIQWLLLPFLEQNYMRKGWVSEPLRTQW